MAGQPQPLASLLRDAIAGDPELKRLRDELRAHVYRNLAWHDAQRRGQAAVRLKRLAPMLPRLIQPAGYSVDKVAAAFVTDPRTSHLADHWAAVWSYRLRGRLSMLLGQIFDGLRRGEAVATGRPASDPTTVVAVPRGTWSDEALVLDTVASDLLIGTAPVYVGVSIAPRPSRASLSESTARRFLQRFADELDSAAKTFTSEEAAAALRKHFAGAPMASERQTARLLRELRPASWASNGRRRAVTIPSADELADAAAAAKQALETRS